MAASLTHMGRRLAFKAFLFQSVSVLLVCLTVLLFSQPATAFAVLLGGLAGIIPNAVFALFAFRYGGATKKQLVVRSFNQGLKLKLALTTIFLVMAFQWWNAAPGPLFGGLAISVLAQWLAFIAHRKEF